MSHKKPLAENDMAAPVISLFAMSDCDCFEQVRLGRKKIDLVFLDRSRNATISVELKISNWKRALWQANVNFQISSESYVAIWHEYIQRAEKNIAVFREYGVGIIVVDHGSAHVHLSSKKRPRRIPLSGKTQWYCRLIESSEAKKGHATLSDVPA